MAESIEAFTLIYLIIIITLPRKGDSPISLIHFKDEGVYVFINKTALWKALVDSELFQDLRMASMNI